MKIAHETKQGRCSQCKRSWVGYKYSTVIQYNGVLNVREVHDLNSYNRENTFNLDIKEIELIKERLKPLTKVNMNPTYGFGANKPTDLPVKKLFYKTNFNTDSTSIYYPEENELPDHKEKIKGLEK